MEIDMSNFKTTEVKLQGTTLNKVDSNISDSISQMNGDDYCGCSQDDMWEAAIEFHNNKLKQEALIQIKNLELGIKSHPIIKGDDVGEIMRIRFAGAIDWIKYFFELNDVEQKDGE